jgi:hypothetical protein
MSSPSSKSTDKSLNLRTSTSSLKSTDKGNESPSFSSSFLAACRGAPDPVVNPFTDYVYSIVSKLLHSTNCPDQDTTDKSLNLHLSTSSANSTSVTNNSRNQSSEFVASSELVAEVELEVEGLASSQIMVNAVSLLFLLSFLQITSLPVLQITSSRSSF